MAKCICIPKKNRIPETGSLNNYVTFYDRSIQPPVGFDTLYGEQLTNGRSFWVNLQPIRNIRTFDKTNIGKIPTHEIWMRNIPDYDIESGDWVEYLGNYYTVVNVSELYVGGEFIHLELRFLGDKNDNINLA